MSRPRFHRLPAEQQDAILDAALQEFATHGFGGSSLNRIISASSVSKGAMYYYFDGKEDLYADVIRRQLERLFEHSGPVPVPEAVDPDGFWAAIEHTYLNLMLRMAETPETGVLLRDWLTGAASPALREAQRSAEQATLPWLEQTVAAGQQIGAIRTDLPADFLIAIALGMGQAMDTRLIMQPLTETELAADIHTLIDMMRRALSA